MIHYRNLAILSEDGNLAADALFASEAAREGGATTQAKQVPDRIFP
jgi:general stress protein YciG